MTDIPPKHPKRPRDPAQLSKLMIDIAIGEVEDRQPEEKDKNPAAVDLERRGGLKGGKVRADRLSPEQRKEIAANAAARRWKKEGD